MSEENFEKPCFCSFCGKSQNETRKLIAGPTVFICDECVILCLEVVVEGGGIDLKDLPQAGIPLLQDRAETQLVECVKALLRSLENAKIEELQRALKLYEDIIEHNLQQKLAATANKA